MTDLLQWIDAEERKSLTELQRRALFAPHGEKRRREGELRRAQTQRLKHEVQDGPIWQA